MLEGSGPLQWLGEPAVAVTNHSIGSEEFEDDSAEN